MSEIHKHYLTSLLSSLREGQSTNNEVIDRIINYFTVVNPPTPDNSESAQPLPAYSKDGHLLNGDEIGESCPHKECESAQPEVIDAVYKPPYKPTKLIPELIKKIRDKVKKAGGELKAQPEQGECDGLTGCTDPPYSKEIARDSIHGCHKHGILFTQPEVDAMVAETLESMKREVEMESYERRDDCPLSSRHGGKHLRTDSVVAFFNERLQNLKGGQDGQG